MKIGELGRITDTPVETIRFYEREGLLERTGRTEANYRIYTAAHAERLTFIRHCRSLDMGLAEIRALLKFKESPLADCEGVNGVLDEHIGHVARRIGELRALEKQLKALRKQCAAATVSGECGILQGLSADTPAHLPVRKASAHVHGSH